MNTKQYYFTDNQLAIRYQVTRNTIWRWVRNDKFPRPQKLNGCARWSWKDVDRWEK